MKTTWWQEFLTWLQGWNQPGTLGDVIPWVITGAVTVSATLIGLISRRKQRSMEQALQVSFWLEELSGARWVARVRNSSKMPIYDVMVSAAHSDLKDSPQVFTSRNVGPERSIDFALRRDTEAPEDLVVMVIFTDSSSRTWELTKNGLSVRHQELAKSFFSNVPLEERAKVQDHSNSFDVNGRRIALEGTQVTRFDLDERDGTNVSLLFPPPEGFPETFGTVAEVMRFDTNQVFVRAFLDLENHILKLMICNLPKDTRNFMFPQQYNEPEHHFIYFGNDGEPAADLMDLARVDHVVHLGGQNLPLDLGAYVSFDSAGHLLCIMIPRDRLAPGYLKG